MARQLLYRWKVLLITEKGVGLWTETWGEDADAATENAEHMSGLEAVMVECIDAAWFTGMTLGERIAPLGGEPVATWPSADEMRAEGRDPDTGLIRS